MAIPLSLPHRQLEQLATRIGQHPAIDLAPRYRKARKLAEHLEFWQLLNCEAVNKGVRLATIAKRTRFTHHQIRAGTKALQFALSTEASEADAGRNVEAVFTSPLARKIDSGITWIDAQSGIENKRARLLFVPSRRVYALWLYCDRSDQLVVVSKPNMGSALRYGRMHSLEDFITALQRRPPIMPQKRIGAPKVPVSVAPPTYK